MEICVLCVATNRPPLMKYLSFGVQTHTMAVFVGGFFSFLGLSMQSSVIECVHVCVCAMHIAFVVCLWTNIRLYYAIGCGWLTIVSDGGLPSLYVQNGPHRILCSDVRRMYIRYWHTPRAAQCNVVVCVRLVGTVCVSFCFTVTSDDDRRSNK